MTEPSEIAPFSLLTSREEAEEVLILSYTANLEFFERFALAAARSLTARVTILADATAVHADPALVRGAGRTYLDGRVAGTAAGVFHPKLLVVAGQGTATVAVGSGNLTLAGWHGNEEIWTALHAGERGPRAIGQIGAWLSELPQHVRMSAPAASAVARVGSILTAIPADEAGPEFVSSTQGRIIERLPRGPVDELAVYAPFFDGDLEALQALIERFQPRGLRIFVQAGEVVVHGKKLDDFAQEYGGEILGVEHDRYRHGKLIEWRQGDQRYALTGSPNLSAPALRRSTAEGGNCEIALIGPLTNSLVPTNSTSLSREEVRSIRFKPRADHGPAIVVLGADLDADGLRLLLREPLAEPGLLEARLDDHWGRVAPVPADDAEPEITLAEPLLGGTALRIVGADRVASAEFFLTDPARVLIRSFKKHGTTQTTAGDLFNDAKLAEDFARDLLLLRGEMKQQARPPPMGTNKEKAGERPHGKPTSVTLQDYLDRCAAAIGQSMTRFGLGLPSLGAYGEPEDEAGDDARRAGEESPMSATSAPKPGPPRTAFARSEKERRRYQRWCLRLVEIAPELPTLGRNVALRLVLRAAVARLWRDPREWTSLVGKVGAILVRPGEEPTDEERRAAASLAAVALAAVRAHVKSRTPPDPVAKEFKILAEAVTPIMPFVDEKKVAEFATDFGKILGLNVRPEAVREIVEQAVNPPDPLDAAAAALAEECGYEVTRAGRLLQVRETGKDFRRILITVLGAAEAAAPVGVHLEMEGGYAAAAWRPRHLVVLRRGGARTFGWLYQLQHDPSWYSSTGTDLPAPKASWPPGDPPAIASGILAEAGLGQCGEPNSPASSETAGAVAED